MSPARIDLPEDEIVRLYVEGGRKVSAYDLANSYGVSAAPIYRILRQNRVLRPPGTIFLRPGDQFWRVQCLVGGKRVERSSHSAQRQDAEKLLEDLRNGNIPVRTRRLPGQGLLYRPKGGLTWYIGLRVHGKYTVRSSRTTDQTEAGRLLQEWIANPSSTPPRLKRQHGQGGIVKARRIWHIRWRIDGVRYSVSSRTSNRKIALALLELVTSQKLTLPLSEEIWKPFLGERRCKRPGCGNIISTLANVQKQYCGDPACRQLRRGIQPKEKICRGCGKSFLTSFPQKEFCSYECWSYIRKKRKSAIAGLAQGRVDQQTRQLKKLDLVETVSKKLADPAKYMWLQPHEVAEAFGIAARTFYRNAHRYRRLRQNQKGLYSTTSVIDQLKNLPAKKPNK